MMAAKGAAQRTYTEPEKMAAMALAVMTSEQHAATNLEIPRPTIAQWLADVGGVVKIRRDLEEKAGLALEDARRATAMEWVRRSKDLSDSELGQTLRAMLPQQDPQTSGAQATAQAGVIVVQLRDGELLELPDPDTQEGDQHSAGGA